MLTPKHDFDDTGDDASIHLCTGLFPCTLWCVRQVLVLLKMGFLAMSLNGS